MRILSRSFYHKDTLEVARGLLGCFLVRKIGRRVIRARIVETEAYVGEDDLACHASKGRTKRTEVMYGEAGHAYVYLIYGMHHCLNIVTEAEDFPAAVLIRAVDIVSSPVILGPFGGGQASRDDKKKKVAVKTDGPGKLCRFLTIDRSLNGWDVTKGEKLWIESGQSSSGETISVTKRVGIDYAKHCREYLWRFVLAEK